MDDPEQPDWFNALTREFPDTLRTDAKTAWDKAWAIYPGTNVEDGQARVAFIAGYLAGLEEGRKEQPTFAAGGKSAPAATVK